IPAGDSVTYTIDVRNTGNVADTFRFSGTPGDWQFSFTPSSLPLDFGSGATSTQVRVVVQSPANALVSHPSLHVVATSTTEANQSVPLRLRAQASGGSSGATVVLLASAQDSIAVSSTAVFTLQLPDLAPGPVTVTGPEITGAAPLNAPLVAIAVGAVAAIAAGVYLGRRRR